MSDPRLSLIIPCYNAADYLPECINSILSQTFDDFELIIINDGSTDNSAALAIEAAHGDKRLKIFDNEENKGVCYSARRGFDLSKGQYISFQTAKDWFYPTFFSESLEILSHHPEAGLCCSHYGQIDVNGNLQSLPFAWSDVARYFTPDEFCEVARTSYIPGHTSIVRRDVFESSGEFDPELKWHADWFSRLVIAFRHGVCFVPKALSFKRVLPQSYSSAGRRDWAEQSELIRYVLRTLKSDAFRDVLPYFMRFSAFSHFGDACVRAVLERPELCDTESYLLMLEPVWRYNAGNAQLQAEVEKLVTVKRNEQNLPGALVKELAERASQTLEAAFRYIDEGAFELARKELERLLEQYPNLPEAHFGLASAAVGMQETEEVRRQLEMITANPASSVDLLNRSGATYFRIGDLERAEAVFRTILERDQVNFDAMNNLSVILVQSGRTLEAFSMLCRAVEVDPLDASLLSSISELGVQLEKRDVVSEILKSALLRAPERKDLRELLALVES